MDIANYSYVIVQPLISSYPDDPSFDDFVTAEPFIHHSGSSGVATLNQAGGVRSFYITMFNSIFTRHGRYARLRGPPLAAAGMLLSMLRLEWTERASLPSEACKIAAGIALKDQRMKKKIFSSDIG